MHGFAKDLSCLFHFTNLRHDSSFSNSRDNIAAGSTESRKIEQEVDLDTVGPSISGVVHYRDM